MQIIGKRKFLLGMTSIVSLTLVAYLDIIDGDLYIQGVTIIFGLFAVANGKENAS